MSPRGSQASLAAGYQLMASHLVWDLHDLFEEGSLRKGDARERLRQFVQMLQGAQRATVPMYSSRSEVPHTGHARDARKERGERLATHTHDEELFEMITAARGDDDRRRASNWTRRACSVLEGIESQKWTPPADAEARRFLEKEVEPFLRRLGRIDQLDRYRPVSRPGLERR
jgi:hypothetical protein